MTDSDRRLRPEQCFADRAEVSNIYGMVVEPAESQSLRIDLDHAGCRRGEVRDQQETFIGIRLVYQTQDFLNGTGHPRALLALHARGTVLVPDDGRLHAATADVGRLGG